MLLVDDSEADRRILRRAVEQEWPDAQIREAASAEEALSLMRSEPADVVLSDQTMGFMSGVELLEVCRRDHPGTLRVLVTGASAFEVGLDAINRGRAHGFVRKDDGLAGIRARLRALRSDEERSRTG